MSVEFAGDFAILWWILAGLLVAVGIAGTVLPALPGVVLVFFGLTLGAWIGGFQEVGVGTIVVLAVLTLLAYLIDFLAGGLGAKKYGASGRAFFGAAIGAVAGIFFGIPGLIFGPFVGAVIGEYSARPDLYQAGRAGYGAWVGLLLGTAAKLALTFLMVGIFITALIF
ncbi:MAG: DUF456 domain-containing protein [Burkholderiales bacterium]